MSVWQLSGWQQVTVGIIGGIGLAFGVVIAVVSAWRAVRRWARALSPLGRRALGWDLLRLELAAGAFICLGAVFLAPYPALQATFVLAAPVAVGLSVFVRAHAEELWNRERQAREQLRPDGGSGRPTAP